jgi:hypothetical protein
METTGTSFVIPYRTAAAFAAGIVTTLIVAAVFVGVRADADPGPDETTYVPVGPCRLVDTRPDFQVGPRSTPIGADETHVQQVTGTNGDCTVPTTATAVSLNVTAVDATAPSFMTVFPYSTVVPNASNLNYVPGEPPVFNKVDVQLNVDGQLGFYNLAGTVDLVADVNGYYVESGLQSLQQQLDRDHVWSAKVSSSGDKIGTGPYTTTRFGTGHYGVTLDVESLGLSDAYSVVDFTIVASPTATCASAAVSTGGGSSISGGILSTITPNVYTFDADGNSIDCSFTAHIALDDRNQRTVLPVP